MGLISFVKNAGASIFGGSEAKAAPADELKKELDKHGLDSSGVKIEVDGDKVKVSGAAKTTEEAEKIAIALGNTIGVGRCKTISSPSRPRPSRGSIPSREATRSGRSPSANTARDTGAQIRRHLPGQPPDADPSGQDLPRPGAAGPAARLRNGYRPPSPAWRAGDGSADPEGSASQPRRLVAGARDIFGVAAGVL